MLSVMKERVLLSKLTEAHYQRAIRLYPYPRFHVNSIRKFLDRIYDIENDLNRDPQFTLGQGITRTLRKMDSKEIRIVQENKGGERIYEKTNDI